MRGRVTHIAPGGAADTHRFDDEFVVGRGEGDLALPDDPFLSGRHFSLRVGPDGCTLTDLGSTNGTYVRIRGEVELQPGDQIRIGGQVFRFML